MADIVETWKVKELYLARVPVDESEWPKLTCSAAKQLELTGSLSIAGGTLTAALGPNMVGKEQLKADLVATLVTNGDNHDHSGGDGARIKHSLLELDGGRNPHGTTAADIGALPISGGTMTGPLTLSAAPTAERHAATKKYVDDNTKAAVDAHANAANPHSGSLAKAGDTMTGPLTLSGPPNNPLHAATKKYIDDHSDSPNPHSATLLAKSGGTMTGKLTIAAGFGLDVGGPKKGLTVGPWPPDSRYMFFGVNSLPQNQPGNYALLQAVETVPGQNVQGETFLNSPEHIRFRVRNANKMTLQSDGLYLEINALKPGGGLWGDYSDKRLKKNVKPLKGTLDKLLKLRGVSYEWEEPKKFGNLTGTQVGLIADEVEGVFPEWVGKDADGYKTLSVRGFEALVIEAFREINTQLQRLQDKNA